MEKLPIDTKSVDPQRLKELEEIYRAITTNYDMEPANENAIELKDFDVFSNLKEAKIGGTLVINNTNRACHLTFVKVLSMVSFYRGTVGYYNYQIWASIKMKKNFGRLLIRRQTLVDEILNIVHPVEIHFHDDSPFNKNFYVVANDEEKAISGMTTGFRGALMDIQMKDFIIETFGDTLILGNNNPITPDYAIYLTGFISKMATIH